MKKIIFLMLIAVMLVSCNDEIVTVVGYGRNYRQTHYLIVARDNGDTIAIKPRDRDVINGNEEWGKIMKNKYPVGSKYIMHIRPSRRTK